MSNSYFLSSSYQESRHQFQHFLLLTQQRWSQARMETYPVCESNTSEDLSIEVLIAPANEKSLTSLVVFTGMHGLEGFVGAGVLQLLKNEYLQTLDANHTSLFIVHALNPWGMHTYQRSNENNVDINRNFIINWQEVDQYHNRGYGLIHHLVENVNIANCFQAESCRFIWNFLKLWIVFGAKAIQRGLLTGQYQEPRGLYYGGQSYQPSTVCAIKVYHQAFQASEQVLFLDIHSGYGKPYQLTLLNSQFEPNGVLQLQEKLAYSDIQKPESYYPIYGDAVDYFYHLATTQYPQRSAYGVCLEYGTVGMGVFQAIKMFKLLVMNHHRRWFTSTTVSAGNENLTLIQQQMTKCFFPSEAKWQKRAIINTRRVLDGIFAYFKC